MTLQEQIISLEAQQVEHRSNIAARELILAELRRQGIALDRLKERSYHIEAAISNLKEVIALDDAQLSIQSSNPWGESED